MSENFDLNQNHYYYNKKNSIPMVFIHGVGLDHQMWDKQISYFNEFSISNIRLFFQFKRTICHEPRLIKTKIKKITKTENKNLCFKGQKLTSPNIDCSK